jgi:hypothetical protein
LYEGRIKQIVRDYADKGVKLIAIAPNGPTAVARRATTFQFELDSSLALGQIFR